MRRIEANGVELAVETFGSPNDPAVLLVMGLGTQMIFWEDAFCAELVERGHHVIRFDNRDVGLSTHLDHLGMPDVATALGAAALGQPIEAPYRLSDMAADTVGLIDALGLEAVHVVGASMGGMIAQTLAIEHPTRLRSLTSIMSTTGDPSLPPPTAEAMGALILPPPPERDAYVESLLAKLAVIGSPGFERDEPALRARLELAHERGYDPAGVARQLVAILASGSRKEALASVTVPTLVLHGADDPLVPLAAGEATAAAIAGAELVVIPGMGHDLPRGAWTRILDAIAGLAARA